MGVCFCVCVCRYVCAFSNVINGDCVCFPACVDLQCIVINGYCVRVRVSAGVCVCACARALQIRPYVNGALYSILSIPSVRQEAREMVSRAEEPAAGPAVSSPLGIVLAEG